MSGIGLSRGQKGMRRGDWLRLASQVLLLPEGTVRHLYRQAILDGVVYAGARGLNSQPLDVRERKDFLEFVSMSLCVGSASEVSKKFLLAGCFVSWSEDGLTAIKSGGIRTKVFVPKVCLDTLLAADFS